MSDLKVGSTSIPGLFRVDLVVHADERGSFTELFQQEKMTELGLPALDPVQTNLSVNNQRGITRGIHAEPWNKFITPVKGEAFVAIVDLRADNFGQVETFELSFGQAVFVPKGCGNSYQTLSDEVYYLYNVDAHWQAGMTYPSIYPFDPDLGIAWPVPEAEAIMSDKDRQNPKFSEIKPL